VLDHTAPQWLARLAAWLEQFETCFSHRAQRGGLRRYVRGLLSDSPRKSMEAMWARLSDPGSYQALQYFISEAGWSADVVWRRLRAVVPAREGVLVLDGTGFPKQGRASVGVQRQYSGTLGKIGNCQVAVTAALWTGVQAWLLGAQLYLPESWLTPEQRSRASIPTPIRFQAKWELALTLLRQIRAAGIAITAVVADAEFGDITYVRRALHRWRLPYALGVSSNLTFFRGTPALRPPALRGAGRPGAPRSRPHVGPGVTTIAARALAAQAPGREWRTVTWRNGRNRAWRARFWACRVTPSSDWHRRRRLAPEVWLLCQRDLGETPETKYFLINLPRTASLNALVQLAHQRWAIEQQYQELKTELGLDHFEGRSFHGWHRHVVLTALTYAFLQQERQRRPASGLTFPKARAVMTEILTAHYLITHPRYLDLMLKLRDIPLRI
jgi:SRSO17 transposase